MFQSQNNKILKLKKKKGKIIMEKFLRILGIVLIIMIIITYKLSYFNTLSAFINIIFEKALKNLNTNHLNVTTEFIP